ncbi:MAG: transcriptional regulator [Methanimicrococcus sp.]|nr:transcriptional regulator [Methanimicrococcus sp.]
MEELIGFVNGSVNRRKILEILESKGRNDAQRIAKIARLIPSATEQILRDLESRGLVQKDGEKFELTDQGKAVADVIRTI